MAGFFLRNFPKNKCKLESIGPYLLPSNKVCNSSHSKFDYISLIPSNDQTFRSKNIQKNEKLGSNHVLNESFIPSVSSISS